MDVANGVAATGPTQNGEREDPGGYKLKFSTVCASNQNRYDRLPLRAYI